MRLKKITDKKVRWVINTGSQDHRWLGNDYFANNGDEIIALKKTAITQASLGLSQIDSLRVNLKERVDGTKPLVSSKPIDGDVNPRYLEVSFSNSCNLKCAYCLPHISSSWMKELKQFGNYPTHSVHHAYPIEEKVPITDCSR